MINLFNEDCLETLKRLEDNSIDLCLTDLPYGILSSKKEADYQNDNRNFCDWDFEINYDEVLPQLKRVMKKDGNILLFAKSPFTFRLYDQMIKHGFTFRYNWIWKKSSCANFATMKYRPGNNYEEVMVFTSSPKKGKYFAHAEFKGEVKTKCKFYNYETRTPIPTEEVFDKYLIPYIFGNGFDDLIGIYRTGESTLPYSVRTQKLNNILKEDVRIPNMGTAGNKMFSANSTATIAGIQLKEILNEDVRFTSGSGNKNFTSNAGVNCKKLQEILKEDIGVVTSGGGGISYTPNAGIQNIKLQEILKEDIGIDTSGTHSSGHTSHNAVTHLKLDQIFKEKYKDQFEIDLENKILYRTVKSYKNFPTSIIDIKYRNDAGKKYKKHPTTKPVEVLEYLLDHYTEENDLVLDMTSGSGSTAVACKNKNRNFVGAEITKVWFDVALQRLDIK